MGKLAPENVRWQIPALLAAERTLGNDPRVRQGLNWRGDILLTAFADDDKGMVPGCWAVEHGNIIGEYKAKLSTIFDAAAVWRLPFGAVDPTRYLGRCTEKCPQSRKEIRTGIPWAVGQF